MLKIDLALFVVTAVPIGGGMGRLVPGELPLPAGNGRRGRVPAECFLRGRGDATQDRGRWMTGAFSFQAVGMVLGATIGFALLMWRPDESTWRLMLLSGSSPRSWWPCCECGCPRVHDGWPTRGELEQAERDVQWLTGAPLVITDEDLTCAREAPTRPPPLLEGDGPADVTLAPSLGAHDIALVHHGHRALRRWIVHADNPGRVGGAPTAGGTTFIKDDIVATQQAAFTDLFLILGFVINILLVERTGRILLQWIGF